MYEDPFEVETDTLCVVPPVVVNEFAIEAYGTPAVVSYLQVAASSVVSESVVGEVPAGNVPEGAAFERTGGVLSTSIVITEDVA